MAISDEELSAIEFDFSLRAKNKARGFEYQPTVEAITLLIAEVRALRKIKDAAKADTRHHYDTYIADIDKALDEYERGEEGK